MTILWVLGDLWKEGGSLIKSGALCHDVIGSHDELMETLEKWNSNTLMGYGPQTYAFPTTRGPTRSLCENPNRKWLSENLALVIFWKNGCFFNLPFLPAKHMNHTIQFAWKIVVTHQGKQEFEVRNKSRTSKQTATCAYVRLPTQPLLHLMFLRICLRRTYAPSRITYAWMMWVPPQSKFHHLEKKTWISWSHILNDFFWIAVIGVSEKKHVDWHFVSVFLVPILRATTYQQS